ncbi:hypothetical protein P7K49_024463, partial [Saguinus oedipus]
MLGKLGERFGPTPSCKASSTRLQGPRSGLAAVGEAQSAYFIVGHLKRDRSAENRSIRLPINRTKQHSKEFLRISASPPLPFRWKPPCCEKVTGRFPGALHIKNAVLLVVLDRC